jgi:phosphodiesterase/alkaline phosphatase D-like protein
MNIKFSRRRFLTTSAGALGAVAMPHLSRAADRPAVTHGVQSGDVTVDRTFFIASASAIFRTPRWRASR